MKEIITYTNEFTGEVFTDKKKCELAEREGKKNFIIALMEQIDRIEDICNTHSCINCPFSSHKKEDKDINCLVALFVDNYPDIMCRLNKLTNQKE